MSDRLVSREAAEDLVAKVDTGGRVPAGWQSKLFFTLAFLWALYHLYIASALPFWLTDWTGLSFVV
ncbi:MAG: hypothetical protein QGF59_28080, partial [Pirellulaceae bacterium]|nr:hypothetical protein [Pirellulaceae bacterium]